MKNKTITAVLGPTNTGKTFLAIETLLSFNSGMIGFPLRLLAREVYDKVIKKCDPSSVALITGEEKIIPSNAKYYLCTVESMPIDKNLEFVAIDEIQMCNDHERGHIFTDRLLNLRGEKQTMFMGSHTMKDILSNLNDKIEFINKERYSKLSYSGHKKISRIETKSAIVAFSTEDVYAIAELLRRQKGGCAIVMGSLSPKTRNSQVSLYQSGDVDYLVATDAIGMGINMDLNNVYLASAVSGKGIGSFPGLALVFSSYKPASSKSLPRNLDLGLYQDKNGIPFTISSNLVYALKTAVNLMNPSASFHETVKASNFLRNSIKEMGFEVIGDLKNSSPAVTTIHLSKTLNSVDIGNKLKESGFELSFNSEYLVKRNWIQVCLMGNWSQTAVNSFPEILKKVCSSST